MKALIPQKILKIAALLTVSYFVTSCSQSKSTNTSSTENGIQIVGQKVLAQCTKGVSTNFSASLSTVIADQLGQSDPNWIKVKFNVVSPEFTKTGITIRFYRMKEATGSTVLDQTPLQSQVFDLSTGQPITNLMAVANPQSITKNSAFYIFINDPQEQYQILKIAFFDTTGKVIENFNILIPEFSAAYSDYQTSPNGSVRLEYLASLHPLKNVSTTNWTAENYKQFYQQFCF